MNVCSDIHNFRYEQEHGPLQMVGPANLALEKIYWMLVMRIRAFSRPEL